jgi:NTP pyrophosphatase (non-canonical NTP hydrolase)
VTESSSPLTAPDAIAMLRELFSPNPRLSPPDLSTPTNPALLRLVAHLSELQNLNASKADWFVSGAEDELSERMNEVWAAKRAAIDDLLELLPDPQLPGTLPSLQVAVDEWQRRIFHADGTPSDPLADALLIAKESGSLSRVVLRRRQGSDQSAIAARELEKRLADVVIAALVFASHEGISLQSALDDRWASLSRRSASVKDQKETSPPAPE